MRIFRIFPWTPRAERRAAVEKAKEEAAKSKAHAEIAARIKRDLERMVEDNHFTEAIHAAITGRKINHANGES